MKYSGISLLLSFSVFLIFFGALKASAYCAWFGQQNVGKFQVAKIELAEIECNGKPDGKLLLPGCMMTFKQIDPKPKIMDEFRTYVSSELCALKMNDIREMKIVRACCDVFYKLVCKEHPSGAFDIPNPKISLGCGAGSSYYVSAYKLIKNGKTIIRESDGKEFQDSKKTVIESIPDNGKISN